MKKKTFSDQRPRYFNSPPVGGEGTLINVMSSDAGAID
jgi:hypothetical protein